MADTPTEFVILDRRDLPSADPKRLAKWDTTVVYEVSPGVRGMVRLPREDFTAETLTAAVRAQLQEREQWVNRKFPL